MALATGTRFASYEITSFLGRGGMGEVYRARDTRLGRDVAVKVLPEAVSRDAERVARFEREARLLATLNHPNIAAIYDFEESADTLYLVLELVEGDTLAGRLKSGVLPVDEALEIAREVAHALEAAHTSGIIHRDLKPGNIKVTPDGKVKVLDFGLAKVLGDGNGEESSRSDAVDSPTITAEFTRQGVVLGTAPYMSPEQLRGRSLDKRTDIWSFGCILYECLSGRRPFKGESTSDVIAQVLQGEPDFGALPVNTPPAVRSMLARCLEKDRRRRLRDAGDALLELDEALTGRAWSTGAQTVAGATLPAAAPGRRRAGIMIGLLATAALLGALIGHRWLGAPGSSTAPGRVSRLSLVLPGPIGAEDWELSPDGSMVAWMGQLGSPDPGRAQQLPAPAVGIRRDSGESVTKMILTRRIGAYEVTPLPGTEGVKAFEFSADGRWIAFLAPHPGSARQRLARVAVDGQSPVMNLAEWQDKWGSFACLASGDILVLEAGKPACVRVPAAGGAPSPSRTIEIAGLSGFFNPNAELPGSSAVLLNSYSWGPQGYRQGVAVLDLDSNRAEQVVEPGSNALYSATGHLIFTRGPTLMAVPFDLAQARRLGDPVAVADGVRTQNAWHDGWFGLGSNGTLVFASGGQVGRRRQVVTVDRQGRAAPWSEERRSFEPCLGTSADGRRLAVVCSNLAGNYEIWTASQDQPWFRRFIAIDDADCAYPVWSRDGGLLAYYRFGRKPEDGVYVRRTDGSGDDVCVCHDTNGATPLGWSADGGRLLVWRREGRTSVFAIGAGGGTDAAERAFSPNPRIRDHAAFSPDGRHVAYSSDDTGRWENYVCPLAADGTPGTSVPVSRGAGGSPLWAPEGDALYWLDNRRGLVQVTLSWEPGFKASEPQVIIELDALRCLTSGEGESDFMGFDVLPGGRFIFVQKGEDETEITGLNVVLNWLTELEGRLAK
jgi:hypothetical protein